LAALHILVEFPVMMKMDEVK